MVDGLMPQASLQPIGWLSPTSIEAMLACPLRLTHGHRAERKDPRSSAAAIGEVAHSLSAEVHSGEFDVEEGPSVMDSIAMRWDALCADARTEMARQMGEAPHPDLWPGHGLAKSRLTRHLANVVASRQSGEADSVLGVEVDLSDSSAKLRGRADRIEERSLGAAIIDLKSGWLPANGVPDSYRRQLIAYAYLWRAEHGRLPSELRLEGLSGAQATIEFSRADIDAHIADVIDRRTEINWLISDGATPHDIAQPSADACRWCSHRPWCSPHWDALGPDWDDHRAHFKGSVVSVKQASDGDVAAVSLISGNVESEAGRVTISGLGVGVEVGQSLTVVGALSTQSADHYRVGMDTVVLVGV